MIVLGSGEDRCIHASIDLRISSRADRPLRSEVDTLGCEVLRYGWGTGIIVGLKRSRGSIAEDFPAALDYAAFGSGLEVRWRRGDHRAG
eukprot:9384969-Pyramimonas_sp.AAC.1